MKNIFNYINQYFTHGHKRSIEAKKNIAASFIIKGLSIAISLLLVPLTINYVNPSKYGIWLTLSSIVAWFSFFDIGLTQGLRNKFAEAIVKNDNKLAQIYVSTTYAILSVIFILVWLIFLLVNKYINWAEILNVSANMSSEISILAVIVFTYFCFQFVFKIVNTLLIAKQQPSKSALVDLIGQIFSLLFVYILVKTTEGSLINLSLALCLSPLIVITIANIFFFRGSYSEYKPKFEFIKLKYAKGLFNIGLTFFVIQLAGIIQFQTANIIIIQNFNPINVTSYNIVFKYFGILNMLFAIFLTPFWSASTEAYYRNDIEWIRNAIRKYSQINILLFVISIIMLVFSDFAYDLWLGKGKVSIEFWLTFWGFVFYNLSMFGGKYNSFLNGISALRLQFISCIISPFVYIGTSLLFIKYLHFGVYSLFLAAIVANVNGYILGPIQYYMIIVKKKKGLWIK